MRRRHLRRPIALVVLTLLWFAPAATQTSPKRPITHDVYDSWRSIQGTTLSRDGVWLAYTLAPQDGDGELVARNLRTGAERRHPRGREPVITPDGRFVIFAVAPVDADLDKAKKDKKKPEEQPKAGIGILNLETGETFTAERVKSFKLPEESSRHVAWLHEPPVPDRGAKKDEGAEEPRSSEKEKPKRKEKKKDPGADLVIRDLASGTNLTVTEVTEYAWTKDGTVLAYAVSSKTPQNDGVYARPPSREAVTATLLQGKGRYKNLALDDAGRQLAFVSDRDDYESEAPRFQLYRWTSGDRAASEALVPASSGLPHGYTVSEHGKVTFSKDGSKLFFGTAPAPTPEPSEDGPEPLKVDLWHWKDPFLQSMQKIRAEQDKKQTYLAVVATKDRRAIQLGSEELPDVTISEGSDVLLASSDVAYRQLVSWDTEYNDYYIVNLRDGSKRRLIQRSAFDVRLSPGGTYVLYYSDDTDSWHSLRLSDNKDVDLTGRLGLPFVDEEWDTPDAPRPYGVAGWTEGDRSVLLYDRYDIWEVKPDGAGARMITGGEGRGQKIVFRHQRTEGRSEFRGGAGGSGDEERFIKTSEPLLLTATDYRTKDSGFYRAAWDGRMARLMMGAFAVGTVRKAKQADVYVFTRSRFDQFPDLWVSDGTFAEPTKVTDANPQQAQFRWGKAELIDYVNADGRRLRATLVKPDDFDPSKKYPLMVYIYEQLTQGLHSYSAPAPSHRINPSRYVSNGYVILMPDIVYDTGYPGESAEKCVLPAVQTVLATGYIDPKRIGIQGHSWGGYQITHLITRTNIFRAVEAGASVSNMVSAYGGIRWESGRSRAFQYEKSQSRIGAPPWTRPLQFIENSPIFWVEKVQTPYLTMHNDEDGAVPWYQGIEFFSALRRLGKEAYLFNYNGEKHGLTDRETQKHFTVHMAEFFDHYLLGSPRPEWMDKGVRYLDRGTRDLSTIYRKTTNDRQ